MEYEVASCAFLKEVVQGNRLMKRVKEAAEGKVENTYSEMRIYI